MNDLVQRDDPRGTYFELACDGLDGRLLAARVETLAAELLRSDPGTRFRLLVDFHGVRISASELPAIVGRGKQLRREILPGRDVRIAALRMHAFAATVMRGQNAVGGSAATRPFRDRESALEYLFGA